MNGISRALQAWLLTATLVACHDRASSAGTGDKKTPNQPTIPRTNDGGRAVPAASRDTGVAKDAGHSPDDELDAGPALPERCGEGDCDLLDPTACTGGRGCVLGFPDKTASEPRTQCVAVGHAGDGASCTSYADCQPGLDCSVGADAGATGKCRHYCCALNSEHGCPSGQFCRIAFEDGHGSRTGVFLCDGCDECDLRDTSACGEGKGCYMLVGTETCRVCLPSGALAPGQECTLNNECKAGSGCFRTSAGSQCLPFCDLTASSCDAGSSCRVATGVSLPPGIGVCF